MSRSGQLKMSRTSAIKKPNEYILALNGEYAPVAYDEERAPSWRGRWRENLGMNPEAPLDLEIGTGNGYHFAHRATEFPQRGLIGIELKYKPLIQSIRRAVRGGANNARIVRYNAYLIEELFTPGELNDVFIHFPDPWERQRQHKHRLIQDEFLKKLFDHQRPGSRLYFKTDSRDYFDWAVERFQRGPFKVEFITYDLHNSEMAKNNFSTHFEKLFLRQGLPIHYAQLLRELI